jgi:hypothetical protein
VDKQRWKRLRYFLDLIEDQYRRECGYEEDASVIAELADLADIARTTLDAWKFQGADTATEKDRDLTYEALAKIAHAARIAGFDGYDILGVVCVIEGRQLVADIPLPTQVALSPRDIKAACLEAIALDMRTIPKPTSKKAPKSTAKKI